MLTGLKHLHNANRWLILIFLVFALGYYLTGLLGKKPFDKNARLMGLMTMILSDIQLLVGLVLYFKGNHFQLLMSDTATVMKTAALRFFAVEHTLGMVVALILVHIGWSKIKKSEADDAKYKAGLIFFGLAFALILICIPWAFREVGIARPWFPGAKIE